MFAIVQNPQDWQEFQLQFLQQLTRSSIPLGPGFLCQPGSFPCMVDAFVTPGQPVTCCFVYPPDAARLLLAAGLNSKTAVAADSILGPPQQAVSPSQPDTPEISEQDAFNRHVSAMLLTVVDLLVQTAIVKPLDFERRLNEGQRVVDEVMTAKKDNLGLDQPLAESTEIVLRRLGFRANEMDDPPKV